MEGSLGSREHNKKVSELRECLFGKNGEEEKKREKCKIS